MARAKATTNPVAAIVKDPESPPRTRLIAGYLGDSHREGFQRLYLDPSLANHVDIVDDDVLHQQPIPNDHFGGVYLWVREGAILIPPDLPSAPEEAEDADDHDDGSQESETAASEAAE